LEVEVGPIKKSKDEGSLLRKKGRGREGRKSYQGFVREILGEPSKEGKRK